MMARPITRRPSRQQVLRSLAELAQLWARPPDPGRDDAPTVATGEASNKSSETPKAYATAPRRARGVR